MFYTVGEMSKILDIPSSTLRYYDKMGLLPFVERSPGGIRLFQEKDYEWLQVIECLKKAGMSLKNIREYITLAMQGDETIEQRLALFQNQRRVLEQQMEQMQHTLDVLNYKCWFYETAKKAGTVKVPSSMDITEIPEQFQETKKNLNLHTI